MKKPICTILIASIIALASCKDKTFTKEQLSYYGISSITLPKGDSISRISLAMDTSGICYNTSYQEFMEYQEYMYSYLYDLYPNTLSYPTVFKNELKNIGYTVTKTTSLISHRYEDTDSIRYYYFYSYFDEIEENSLKNNKYIILYYYLSDNENRIYNAKMELHEDVLEIQIL